MRLGRTRDRKSASPRDLVIGQVDFESRIKIPQVSALGTLWRNDSRSFRWIVLRVDQSCELAKPALIRFASLFIVSGTYLIPAESFA